MSDLLIFDEYMIRGKPYEVWSDGSRLGDYPNWWLCADHHKPGWALTETDFDPPLTMDEIQHISEAVYDYYAGD